jgi:catechol 2,3-dioxygenase-like lactoylglutathione lyase family enzyme
MTVPSGIKVLFVAGFGPIVQKQNASREFYAHSLGLAFEEDEGGYLHTGKIEGVKHFALWPLSQAAQSCFGRDTWPRDIPIPQAWLEFDVEHVDDATEELKRQGYKLVAAMSGTPLSTIAALEFQRCAQE